MGMFDNIRCRRTLPDGYVGDLFQTKDFDCELALYEIAEDGALLVQRFDIVPDGPPGDHPFLGETIKDWQKYKRINERWEPVGFHGDCYFYTYEGDINADEDVVWHEYRARFTEGRLTSLIVQERGKQEVSPLPGASPAGVRDEGPGMKKGKIPLHNQTDGDAS